MHHDPVGLILDYARDAIVFDGDDLPFPLSQIQIKVIQENDRAVAVLTLEVDAMRIIPPPEPEPVEPESVPTPVEAFEEKLARIARRGQ
ncbi:hypothetical protein Y710_16400 [Gordonia sp. QH-12]|uniref:hypothetical protein n=1 Tax=Gordonia sp. QH-12 TaxID=1437876 RepID=UPI000781CBE1|nr:hypothetical protein [Gordonia sp. QH-12]KXT55929.1 hypothetical protein Y710_16400 [Gordonia sp. QH-12]